MKNKLYFYGIAAIIEALMIGVAIGANEYKLLVMILFPGIIVGVKFFGAISEIKEPEENETLEYCKK